MNDAAKQLLEHAKLVKAIKANGWSYETGMMGNEEFTKDIGGLTIRISGFKDGRSWSLTTTAFKRNFSTLEQAFQAASDFEREINS